MKKKTIPILLAMSIMAELAGCGKKDDPIPYALNDVLTTFSDNTKLDELMEIDKSITINVEEQSEEISFAEAINQLEEKLEINQTLMDIKIKASTEATDALKKQFSNLSLDEVKLLLNSAKNGGLKDIEKVRIQAGLSWIAAENQEWIQANGLNIAEQLLKSIIKVSACETSGLETQYYDTSSISQQPSHMERGDSAAVSVTDPISEEEISYYIDLFDDNILAASTLALYNLQALEKPSSDTVISYCQKALDYAKLVAASGVELTEDRDLTSTTSSKEAKKLIMETMPKK